MTDRELMQQAADVLQAVRDTPASKDEIQRAWIVSDLLKRRLAQPEQEPSGWRLVPVEPTQEMLRATEVGPVNLPMFCWIAMLSAAPNPPQRTWQGLTDEEELIPMPLFADWPGGWK